MRRTPRKRIASAFNGMTLDDIVQEFAAPLLAQTKICSKCGRPIFAKSSRKRRMGICCLLKTIEEHPYLIEIIEDAVLNRPIPVGKRRVA